MHAYAAPEGKNWKVKELQCIHFTNPELVSLFSLAGSKPERCSCCFCKYMTTTMFLPTCAKGSMLEMPIPTVSTMWSFSTPILADQSRSWLRSTSRGRRMLVLRSIIVAYVKDYKLDTNNAHISVETSLPRHSSAYDKAVHS